MQRTIQIVTTTVIVNKRITTLVTLQFQPNKGSSNVNVTVAHRNIFSALKLKTPTLKIIAPQNNGIDTLLTFSDGNGYTKTFTKIFKDSRIYILHLIESARALRELKHGSKQEMSNIFDTLVNDNAFLSHKKFQSHKENAISFFVDLSLCIILRDTLREKIQDALMWIDLGDEISKPMIHEIKDKEGNPTGK